jgi:hypothetical protein
MESLAPALPAANAPQGNIVLPDGRVAKFLLHTGHRPAVGVKSWTLVYMAWIKQIHFAQMLREFTLLDYLHEVEHLAEHIKGLEQTIAGPVKLANR